MVAGSNPAVPTPPVFDTKLQVSMLESQINNLQDTLLSQEAFSKTTKTGNA